MEMVYMEMAVSQERIKELRREDEHDRPEDGLAQARLSREDVLQEAGPYTGIFPNTAWRIERWRDAGW
jgi:hypothetical protein